MILRINNSPRCLVDYFSDLLIKIILLLSLRLDLVIEDTLYFSFFNSWRLIGLGLLPLFYSVPSVIRIVNRGYRVIVILDSIPITLPINISSSPLNLVTILLLFLIELDRLSASRALRLFK